MADIHTTKDKEIADHKAALAKKESEHKDALAATESAVQKAVSEAHAAKDKEIAEHKAALTKKESEHKKAVADIHTAKDKEIADHKETMVEMGKKHEDLKLSKEKELEVARSDRDDEVRRKLDAMKAANLEQMALWDEEMKGVLSTRQLELNNLAVTLNSTRKDIETKLNAVIEEKTLLLDAKQKEVLSLKKSLEAEHKTLIEAKDREHKKIVADLSSARDKDIAEHKAAFAKKDMEHKAAIVKKDKELQAANAANDAAVQKAIDDVHAIKNQEISEHKSLLSKKEAEYGALLASREKEYKTAMAAKDAEHVKIVKEIHMTKDQEIKSHVTALTTKEKEHKKIIADINNAKSQEIASYQKEMNQKVKEHQAAMKLANVTRNSNHESTSLTTGYNDLFYGGCAYNVTYNETEAKFLFKKVSNLADTVRNFSEMINDLSREKDITTEALKSSMAENELLVQQIATLQQKDAEIRGIAENVQKSITKKEKSDRDLHAKISKDIDSKLQAVELFEGKLSEAQTALRDLQEQRTISQKLQEELNSNTDPKCSEIDIQSIVGKTMDSNGLNLTCPKTTTPTRDDIAATLLNYATPSAGAKIRLELTSDTYSDKNYMPNNYWIQALRMSSWVHSGIGIPEDALSEEMSIGHCWPMKGTNGTLTVELAEELYVHSVTIDHILPEESKDIRSAPKHFKVFSQGNLEDDRVFLLADVYDISKKQQAQNFVVPENVKQMSARTKFVTLELLDNHGKPEYTCLYRFRIHGHLVKNNMPRDI